MIDLHCHLLPGVDDGARDIAEALDLARAAVADGITHCIATPHIFPERYKKDLEAIRQSFHKLRCALDEEQIPLKLGVAAEIRLSGEIPNMVLSKQAPFLGEWYGFKILLLELPHSHIPPGTEKLIRWLGSQGIRPMIAHPERNEDMIRDFGKVMLLMREGGLFQLTAGSLVGDWGEAVQQCAFKFLEREAATIIATDAHHAVARPPQLRKGREVAAKLIGDEASWKLVTGNPGKIAANHFCRTPNPHLSLA